MVEFGQRDILLTVVQLLNRYKIAYLLSGSFAVSYFGFPRSTHDIDFVIELKNKDIQLILQIVESLGKSYLFDENQIREAIGANSQFNIYHMNTGIKIDFWIMRNTIFEKNKFKRSKELILDKQNIRVVSPEDLILTKLLWCKRIKSERHVRDCIGILKVQKDKLDMNYLLEWVKKLKLGHLFEKAMKEDYD